MFSSGHLESGSRLSGFREREQLPLGGTPFQELQRRRAQQGRFVIGPDGVRRELATVWFTGWLEPGSLPGQKRRLAVAAFVSHSDATGGEHAAPIVAAVLSTLEQKGK